MYSPSVDSEYRVPDIHRLLSVERTGRYQGPDYDTID